MESIQTIVTIQTTEAEHKAELMKKSLAQLSLMLDSYDLDILCEMVLDQVCERVFEVLTHNEEQSFKKDLIDKLCRDEVFTDTEVEEDYV